MRENDLYLLCETLREENAKLIKAVNKLSSALKEYKNARCNGKGK